MNRRWIGWAIGLSVWGQAIAASARPAEVFQAHLGQIRQELPSHYVLRLPSEILLGGPGMSPDEMNQLIVKVLPASTPPRLTISLFTCNSSPYPCLVGSFSVESVTSQNAQRELLSHQRFNAPITLAEGVRGYLREGSALNPPSDFSSVMWQQDQMIYTVSFLATERQNILYMARSMANQPPILSMQVPTASGK
ncbi:MAG TPA: hypothetical protein V6C57_15935 [Coleofasciculaceae cyanobacterium]